MNLIKNLYKGAIIGVANIIPGVSGGTMALVLGIYERIITAIHNISLKTAISTLRLLSFRKEHRAEFKQEMKKIDAGFLIVITAGALAAVLALAELMTWLLTKWHDPTYGFFFGLILISAATPYILIKKKSAAVFIAAVIAVIGVLALSHSVSGDRMIEKAKVKHQVELQTEKNSAMGNETADNTLSNARHYSYIFVLGAVGISAMILPGVSGSFLLLLLGGYFEILSAIARKDLMILAVFALGCGAGIIIFTRLLNYLLLRWHDMTMGFLFGLVVGSLWMVWPFKYTASVGDEIIYLGNRMPGAFTQNEALTLCAALAGMVVVAAIIKIESSGVKKE